MLLINYHNNHNIAMYCGCIREGQQVTGISLKKYNTTLSDFINGNVLENR